MPDQPDDQTPSAPEPTPGAVPPWTPAPTGAARSAGHDLEVDLAAFLPEGSDLAGGGSGGEGEVAADDDLVVEELVYGEPDGEVGLDPADTGVEADGDVGGDVAGSQGAVASESSSPATASPATEPPATEPVDLTALTRIEADLEAVDRALAALDDGSYGTCPVCGRPVDPALLAADPVRRGCADHPTDTDRTIGTDLAPGTDVAPGAEPATGPASAGEPTPAAPPV